MIVMELVATVGGIGSVGTTIALSYHRLHQQTARELHAMERQRAALERLLTEKVPYPGLQDHQRPSEALGAVQDTIWMDVVGIPLELWMQVKEGKQDLEVLKARRDAGGFLPKVLPPDLLLQHDDGGVTVMLPGGPATFSKERAARIKGAEDEHYVFGTARNGQKWRVRRAPTVIFSELIAEPARPGQVVEPPVLCQEQHGLLCRHAACITQARRVQGRCADCVPRCAECALPGMISGNREGRS